MKVITTAFEEFIKKNTRYNDKGKPPLHQTEPQNTDYSNRRVEDNFIDVLIRRLLKIIPIYNGRANGLECGRAVWKRGAVTCVGPRQVMYKSLHRTYNTRSQYSNCLLPMVRFQSADSRLVHEAGISTTKIWTLSLFDSTHSNKETKVESIGLRMRELCR